MYPDRTDLVTDHRPLTTGHWTLSPPRPILLAAMDWGATLVLAVILSALALALLRSDKRRRRRLLLLIPLPLVVLVWRWAAYRQAWIELALAVAISTAVVVVWWLAYGRRLPPPSDDNIRVWTQNDPF